MGSGEKLGHTNIYDIYGNEKQGAWKYLLKKYESKPPDTGLSYPDTSWWADPNLLTGNEYNLLMMWLTEPVTYSGKGYGYAGPIPRITALRGIVVSHSRTSLHLKRSGKYKEMLKNYYGVVEDYEKEILGDEYISEEDLANNIKKIPSAGSFYNYNRRTRLSAFKFRRPPHDRTFNRRFIWVFPEGEERHGKEWLEIPDLLYRCLTIPDKTLEGPEFHKRNIGTISSHRYSGSLPPLDIETNNLILSYEDILKTQRKD